MKRTGALFLALCWSSYSKHLRKGPLNLAKLELSGNAPEDEAKADALESALLRMSRGETSATPLKTIADLIEPQLTHMQNAIRNSSSNLQKMLDNFTTSFNHCSSFRATGNSQAGEMLKMVQNASTSHKSCRTAQATEQQQWDACNTTMQALEGTKTSSCDAYNTVLKVPSVSLVPPPISGEKYVPWLVRVRNWVTAELNAVQTKNDACVNATAAINQKKNECLGTNGLGGEKKELEDKIQACDAAQTALETRTCAYATKVETVCETFKACFNVSNVSYHAQLANIRNSEAATKVEWRLVARMRCYVEIMTTATDGSPIDASKVDECRNKTHSTDSLSLTYPTPSVPSSCDSLVSVPCSSPYLAAEYSNLPANAPSKPCTACVTTPPPTPAPAPSATLDSVQALGFSGAEGGASGCCRCNYVLRAKLRGSALPDSGALTQIRIRFLHGNYGIAYVAIGEESTPGVMTSGTVQNVCFPGQVGACTTAVSMKSAGLWSNWTAINLDKGKNYYISYLHLCGPGGASSGTTPDGIPFSGYNTGTSDEFKATATSGVAMYYNALRSNGLAATKRGPDALVYGHFSREPGASITGGWKAKNTIEGVAEVQVRR